MIANSDARVGLNVLALWFEGYYVHPRPISDREIDAMVNASQYLIREGYKETVRGSTLFRSVRLDTPGKSNAPFKPFRELVRQRALSLPTNKAVSFTTSKLAAAIYAKHNLDTLGEKVTTPFLVIVEVPVDQLKIVISTEGLVRFFQRLNAIHFCRPRSILTWFQNWPLRYATRHLRSSFWDYAWSNEVLCVVSNRSIRPVEIYDVQREYDGDLTKFLNLDPRLRRKDEYSNQ